MRAIAAAVSAMKQISESFVDPSAEVKRIKTRRVERRVDPPPGRAHDSLLVSGMGRMLVGRICRCRSGRGARSHLPHRPRHGGIPVSRRLLP